MTPELVDFAPLRDGFPRLYRTVSNILGIQTIGTYAVDFSKLSDFTRGELSSWLKTQKEKEASASPPQPSPEPAVSVTMQPEEPQISMSDILREEQADLQRASDQARATQRLIEYAAGGLEDTKENADAFREFVQAEAKSYWSREVIDVAIQRLGPCGTNQLTWKPKVVEAPPSTKPAESVEVLEPWQLRIDATEAEMKRADVRALKDLIARRRAATTGKYIRARGYFGSSIF